ncbi:MAG: FAD synthase, partial [Thermoplasmata archaeon HGW-Thermoplasmata-2]
MIKVMASGVFDILHMGHIYFLEEARKLGDRLAVVVACDATVRKLKHE